MYVTDEDRQLLEVINGVFIISIFCVLGTVSNCINIVVFYKQGFRNTVNISLFSLAIADLCSLITLQWIMICVNPWFASADIHMVPYEIQYLTGSLPHVCFVRISGWITVYITAERCLCITFPLKIKQLVTRRSTVLTILTIYGLIILVFPIEGATCYFGWKFYPKLNKTLVGMLFRSNRKSMEGFLYVLVSLTGFTLFIAIIIFTIILVVQLKRKSKWREKASSVSEATSARDTKTMRMVAAIATVLIICFTPGVLITVLSTIEPMYNVIGIYANAFFVSWSFAFIFEGINSTVNIFIYYHMSTKYRTTFHLVLGGCCGTKPPWTPSQSFSVATTCRTSLISKTLHNKSLSVYVK